MTKYIASAGPYGVFEKQVLSPDGVQNEFDLLYQVGNSTSILVMSSGVIQEPNVSYTISEGGRKIVFSYTPTLTERIYIIYLGRELSVASVVGNFPIKIRLTGDGLTNTFDLTPFLPNELGLLREEASIIFINGIEQKFGINWQYDVAPGFKVGNQLEFFAAPPLNSVIDVFVVGVERSDIKTVDPGSITGDKFANNITIGGPTNKVEALYVKNLFADNPIGTFITGEVIIKTHNDFSNSESHILTNAIQTTDNSPTIIWSHEVYEDSMTWFDIDLVGYNVDTDENIWIHLKGGVKRRGAIVTLLDPIINDYVGESSDFSAFMDVSGQNIQAKVIGDPVDAVNWSATIRWQSITSSIV